MTSRPLTRQALERAARELAGWSPTPDEVRALLDRLQSLHEELRALEVLIGSGCEPLPAVVIEVADAWPKI